MTTQEIWQLQALEAPRVSAAYMRHRARDLASRTRIRNGSNYAGGVLCALFLAWCGWRYPGHFLHRPVMITGLALGVLASVYLLFRWHHLASAAKGPEDAGVIDSVSFYRHQLERQRDARRNWRRRLPVVPGLITVLASFVLELNPIPWALLAMVTIFMVGVFSFAIAFEEWTARRLQREIDALDLLVVKDPTR
jgi:MFS family permease